MPESAVVVVGGGASGLSAAAALTRRGIRPVVLEQDAAVGGALKRNAVRIRPAVASLTPDGVRFADGTHEAFDAIVAATGYTTGLSKMLSLDGALNAAGEPTVRSGESAGRPGLYFIGFTHTLRGHLFEKNRDSRRLARNVERYLAAPA